MGVSTPHALSRQQLAYAVLEATPGTQQAIAGTDAFKMMEMTISKIIEQSDVEDTRLTRSYIERTREKGQITFSTKTHVRPSGTAGTPPDVHPLLKAAFGAYTNTPATSDVYSLSNTQVLDTLTIERQTSSVWQEIIRGAIVDRLTIDAQSGSRPSFTFEGRAMGYAHCGYSTLNGAIVASDQVIVQTADASKFQVGGIISIGGDDNGGAGYVITAISGATLTVDTTLSADDADPVVPFSPTQTTAGTPASGIVGSLTLDAVTYPIQGCNVVIDNQNVAFEDVALEQFFSDAVPGYRNITGSVQVKLRRDHGLLLGHRELTTTRALVLTLGATASGGSRCQLSLPYVEYGYEPIDAAEGSMIMNIPFKALGSSGDDEATLTFD